MTEVTDFNDSSEDTIILSENETKTTNIDDILKKYSSDEVTFKNFSSNKSTGDPHEFSDDEWINEPLIKRLKSAKSNETTKEGSSNIKNNSEYARSTSTNLPSSSSASLMDQFSNLSDDSCDLDVIKNATGYKSDDEMDSLYNKYFQRKPTHQSTDIVKEKQTDNAGNGSSNDDDGKKYESREPNDENFDEYLEGLYEKYNIAKPEDKVTCDTTEKLTIGKGKRKSLSTQEKEQKKQEREAAKIVRVLRKEELAKEKAMKEALRTVEKNLRPEECMKFITVNIDDEILEAQHGDLIKAALEKAEVNFKNKSQLIPNSVTWTRKVQTVDKEKLKSIDVEEKNILVLMDSKKFLEHVKEKTLLGYLQSIYSVAEVKQLSLSVYGLGDYYKYRKSKSENKKNFKLFEGYPNVSRKEVEYALAELQIMCPCYFRPLENNEEISMFIMECTKAVAQLPFKLKNSEKYEQATEYYAGDNKDCVRVDKNGNGLSRLWTQILTMFPLARLETAEAITAVYSNPKSLFKAYENCESPEEGMKLLQELQVRRAAGPFSTVKRIGPEMSRKIYNFFNSCDSSLL